MATGKVPFKTEKKAMQNISKDKLLEYLRKVTPESIT